ncbi:hypothetical protein MMC26_000703 [Xylographa opegraphella]|nr:hypothetical protein [Xylographa opegraphella]
MIIRLLGCLAFSGIVAQAAQPSAAAPVSAPLRELPWGQINFLHTTDTHGWHAGHLQEPSFSADWGDYISFADRLRERADEEGVDLLLIDTGDRIEGNGLYDASDPKGIYTSDILKEQEIDVITVGNHELYKQNSSNNEYLETVPNFKGNYIASNLDIIDPRTGERVPLARRYRKFTTKNQGIRVVAFGFLFDFKGNANNTIVQKVQDTIHEEWFKDAIHDREVDLFVVAGHVHIRSEEYRIIFRAIREVQWDTPIQLFGGHYHIRDYKKFDSKSYAIESGRYMETIGFQSISGVSTGGKDHSSRIASITFSRRYIDNNLYSFYHHTSLNSTTFPTAHGSNVSSLISSSRKALKLDLRFGCAPIDLWTNRVPYPDNSSIFSWLEQLVLPDMVIDPERKSTSRVVIANTGAMRFDIFKGPFTIDTTFTVSPFSTGFRYIKDVPFKLADQLLTVLNNEGEILKQAAPHLEARMLTSPEQAARQANIIAPEIGDIYKSKQQPLVSYKQRLTPGYTTKDDAGEDGDDTVHSPISFYNVPNCIEARIRIATDDHAIETVDVVYLEFIQPWVLLALKFLGGEYETADTKGYLEGVDFTTMIAQWVKENWDGDC